MEDRLEFFFSDLILVWPMHHNPLISRMILVLQVDDTKTGGMAKPARQQDSLLPFDLPAVAGKKITAACNGSRLTSNAGFCFCARSRANTVLPSGWAPAIGIHAICRAPTTAWSRLS